MAAWASHLRTNRQLSQEILCRITVVDTMYALDDGIDDDFGYEDAVEEHQQTACIPILDDRESDMILDIELPSTITQAYRNEIESGTLLVSVSDATIVNYELNQGSNSTITAIDEPPSHIRHLFMKMEVFGTKSLMVVRVSTADGVEPDYSLNEMRQGIFYNAVSMKSQFEACSFGKLKWIDAGGLDVRLDQPLSAFKRPVDLVNAAQDKIMAQMPNLRAVSDLADRVIFCQPPGTGNWLAVAPINHWRVNMNNDWCLSLSALMHEMGHTKGLLHSGRGPVVYGDKTGYMGYGDKRIGYPRKCYNGAKHYQLGWYNDREALVNPFRPSIVKLAAFVDYDKTASDEPVLLNIGNLFFLQYNRAKSFNIDTEQAADEVTITRERDNEGSKRITDLKEGQTFRKRNFAGTGKDLVIQVCERVDATDLHGVDYMSVSVGLDVDCNGSKRQMEERPIVMMQNESMCNKASSKCSGHSECCGSLKCIGNKASKRTCQACRKRGQKCSSHAECCQGLRCKKNACRRVHR